MTRALALVWLASCGREAFPAPSPCASPLAADGGSGCEIPGYPERRYDVWLPPGEGPHPVIVVMHGGGGKRSGAASMTCPAGDPDAAGCLHRLGTARGFAVVFPDGTPGEGWKSEMRSWNAGGGEEGWRCVGGQACAQDVDDVAFTRALIDDLRSRFAVGPVFATGLSNGGAMSHRLGCEAADLVTAIAPVGGQLQRVADVPCAPSRPVPALVVHGVDDPCWPYAGGPPDCPIGREDGNFVSVEASLSAWEAANGCDGTVAEDTLPDTVADGTRTTRLSYGGCAAPLVHLRIDGGGHAWPNGQPYLRERTIGVVPKDWGSEVIVDFFEAQLTAGDEN